MNKAFTEQVDSLIDSSISIHRMNGQKLFARRIELSSLGHVRASSKLVEDCVKDCERRNIRCNYNEHTHAFNLQIPLEQVAMNQTQAVKFNR